MMSRSGDPPLPCTTGLASVVVYDSMIDVVILAWNDGELLDQAVESALASVGSELRVWIVDNGSDPPVPAPTDPESGCSVTITTRGFPAGAIRACTPGLQVWSACWTAMPASSPSACRR